MFLQWMEAGASGQRGLPARSPAAELATPPGGESATVRNGDTGESRARERPSRWKSAPWENV